MSTDRAKELLDLFLDVKSSLGGSPVLHLYFDGSGEIKENKETVLGWSDINEAIKLMTDYMKRFPIPSVVRYAISRVLVSGLVSPTNPDYKIVMNIIKASENWPVAYSWLRDNELSWHRALKATLQLAE